MMAVWRGWVTTWIFGGTVSLAAFPSPSLMQFKIDTSTTLDPIVSEEVYFRRDLLWKVYGEVAGRGRQNAKGFFSVDYKLELGVPWWSFFSTSVRLVTHNIIPDNFATTTLFGEFNLQIPIWHFGFILGGGWYEKFTSVDSIKVLSTFYTGGMVDRDVSLRLGFWVDLSSRTRFQGLLCSFEPFDVFYFHNPFFEAALRYTSPKDWRYSVFARYKMLLGFGQLDGWTLGLAISPP